MTRQTGRSTMWNANPAPFLLPFEGQMKQYDPELVEILIEAAREVKKCWDNRDLARAVNDLNAACDELVTEKEPDTSIFDEEPANAES